MPELPEVELVARALRPLLVGRRIVRVETTGLGHFFLSPSAVLCRELPGESIRALERQGKYLRLAFRSGRALLLHLGMTGQLLVAGTNSPRRVFGIEPHSFEPDRHTHLQLHFAGRHPPLFFRDTRKFGRVRLLEPGASDPRLDKLGPDATQASAEHLFLASRARWVAVKSWLLDQSVLAGIGNIYADESLFLARLAPERPARSLSLAECRSLAEAIQKILERAIRAGGSSISDYVHPDGSEGGFQQRFAVYGRTELPCRRCRRPIQRLVLGQRSSHFCAHCQR